MLISVTTVKDTLENIDLFVRRNLAAGLDHLVLFLDGEQPEIVQHFAGSPYVTCVPAWDQQWWGPGPKWGLNARQNRNAAVVNAVCTVLPGIEWMFHIDADEVVQLDRERLERLGPRRRAVVLKPREAVSHEDAAGDGIWFKRLLKPPELAMLVEKGIGGPTNADYFRGHRAGKSGWRPALDVRTSVHRPLFDDLTPIPALKAPWLRLLHFESMTPQEFVRKWRNLIDSGTGTLAIRKQRHEIADAVALALAGDIAPEDVDAELAGIYRTLVRDPFPELLDLGLLVHVDVDAVRYEPRALPADQLAHLRRLLAAASGVDKSRLLGSERGDALGEIVDACQLPGMESNHRR